MVTGDTRYELPREHTTLLGYLCRRAHKTEILLRAADHVRLNEPADALMAVGLFAAAASVSYGRAHYQPRSSQVGEVYSEPDPSTGIAVAAELVSPAPALRTRLMVDGPGWSALLNEEISGTTFGLGTLAMPAPSTLEFIAGDYRAQAFGIMTTQLIPLPGFTRVRGYGELALSDSTGARGSLSLSKKGEVAIEVGEHAMTENLRP